jgi:hypothetical protein
MQNTKYKEIREEIHIKWLSKAKTTKIDGIELTILPYGYLKQAINEALEKRDRQIENKIENLIRNRPIKEIGSYLYDKALQDFKRWFLDEKTHEKNN